MKRLLVLLLLTGCSGGAVDFAATEGEGGDTGNAGSFVAAAGSHAASGASSTVGAPASAGEAGAPHAGGTEAGGAATGGSGGQAAAGEAGVSGGGGAMTSGGTGGSETAGSDSGGSANGGSGEPTAGAPTSEGGAAGSGPEEPPCVCDSGACCDGCHFRPKSFFCGETIRASTCTAPDRIEHDYWNLFCNGDSTECTRWAVHTKYVRTDCNDGLVCEGPDNEAECIAP